MDKYNMFHTKGLFGLMRLDYLVLLVGCSVLALLHVHEMRWWAFIAAFAWIDVIGTIPGYFVYYRRRSGERRSVPVGFYYAYNFCHSIATNAVVIAVWAFASGWEWAMLGIPIHLLGDRAVLGNVYKTPGVSFVPEPFQGFGRFLKDYDSAGQW